MMEVSYSPVTKGSAKLDESAKFIPQPKLDEKFISSRKTIDIFPIVTNSLKTSIVEQKTER